MATFILFGKYCPDALKGVSTVRTKKAAALVRKLKGKVVGMYAMLGETDLVFILELPRLEAAIKTSDSAGFPETPCRSGQQTLKDPVRFS